MSNELSYPSGPVNQPSYDPASTDAIDVRVYLDIFRRRWLWIIGTGALFAGAVSAYQWDQVSHPLYTAEVLVQRLTQQNATLGTITMTARPNELITSELEILRTGQVLGAVVDSTGLRLGVSGQPGLRSRIFDLVAISPSAAAREYELRRNGDGIVLEAAGQPVASMDPAGMLTGPGFVLGVLDPSLVPAEGLTIEIISRDRAVRALESALDTEQPIGTNLIQIRYTSTDAQLAADVANNVAFAYQTQAAGRARDEATRRREFLAGRLETVADSLQTAQDILLEFQANSSTVNPQAEGQTISNMLSSAREELRRLRANERMLLDLQASLQGGGRDGLRQIMIVSSDLVPAAQDLYARLRQFEERRSNLINVNRRTENSPDVQLLDSMIAETKLEMGLTVAQTLRLVRQNRESAEARVGELQRQLGDVPERNVAFARLSQRVEAIQRMHELLAARFYEAQIAEAVEAGDVQIIDPAVGADRTGWTDRKMHPILPFMAGLLLTFVGVVAREKLDTRVRTTDEVRRFSGAEILAGIPRLPPDGKGRYLSTLNATGASEAFRMLRTNLRFARAEEARRVAVTSAGPAEGKSVVASNLAIALAQSGRSVLLVDADLRRPVLHDVFAIRRVPGLSDVLVGEEFAAIVQKTEHGVDVLTAGTDVPNPAELIGSPVFIQFLDRVQRDYDIILIDTPPVLSVSESSLIAASVDGVILMVRQDQTHTGALSAAADQLRRSRATVLGVVVNDIEVSARSGYGYNGHYYGYHGDYSPQGGAAGMKANGDGKGRRRRLPLIGRGHD